MLPDLLVVSSISYFTTIMIESQNTETGRLAHASMPTIKSLSIPIPFTSTFPACIDNSSAHPMSPKWVCLLPQSGILFLNVTTLRLKQFHLRFPLKPLNPHFKHVLFALRDLHLREVDMVTGKNLTKVTGV